jgi:nitrous oxide reductase accessory protein NosL
MVFAPLQLRPFRGLIYLNQVDSISTAVHRSEDSALMVHPRTRLFVAFFVMLFVLADLAAAEVVQPVKPSPKDKCPVCGMFVAKYPDWVGEIIFEDGAICFFDGAKDLFKYYFNLKKYNPRKEKADIAAIYVTEYYDVTFISAYDAFYVMGSNVYGPMGRELVPLRTEADAEEFTGDHKGKKIVTFKDMTPALIQALE